MAGRFRRHKNEAPELNITAFMNLMVVLVPFLLMTAVFSQISILELNLPTDGGDADDKNKPKLALEIIIRADALDIRDRASGRLAYVTNTDQGYNVSAMREALHRIKQQFRDITAVSLLMEEETPYESLILVMDSVRAIELPDENGVLTEYALFPDVSIGDAPVVVSAGGGKKK